MGRFIVTGIFVMGLAFLVASCTTTPPTPALEKAKEQVVAQKPNIIHFYEGAPLPKEEAAFLIGAEYEKQAKIFIIEVDGIAPFKKQGLIGGANGAVVLPGTHHITLQFHDKERMTVPIKLPDVTVEAGRTYLVDFRTIYGKGSSFLAMLETRISIAIQDLDNKDIIYSRTVNSRGMEEKTVVHNNSEGGYSITLPADTVITEKSHALGGNSIIQYFWDPRILHGISHNRIVLKTDTGPMSVDKEKDFIKSGYKFWTSNIHKNPIKKLSEKWIIVDNRPAYFTVSREEGFQEVFTALSVLRGDFSYVIFDNIRSEHTDIINEEERLKEHVMRLYRSMKFDEVKNPNVLK